MKYLAHTKDGEKFTDEIDCQELKEHLINTAKLAKEKAANFGAGGIGEIIGLFHDVGKYDMNFQDKIRHKTKKSVKHAMAAAYAFNKYYGPATEFFGIIVASHHTGLPDFGIKSNQDNNTYCGKYNGYCKEYEKGLQAIFSEYEKEIDFPKIFGRPSIKIQKDNQVSAFQISSYIRMLFSVLVDSDFTDTEEFCTGIKRTAISCVPDIFYDKLIKEIPQNDGSRVNDIRAGILENCLEAANMPQGFFSLTVPTGGGKTLSSLAFALKHAIQHNNLRRIIYVIPYTSIIEQNADVFKKILGDDVVLEHHSGISADSNDFQARWATENWDIPVVVTTNVQFFESLFSNKTSKARKIHNIANSVIIFDEAQMLPLDYLSPCMAMVSELVENYGVTAVLCSATQPLVDKYIYKNLKTIEIAKNPEELATQLKRVEFHFAGKKTDEELVDEIGRLESVLVIVNSRRHAFALYNAAIQNNETEKDSVFYLSTLLVPVHRSKKIKQIKERLNNNLPVRVISTQLMECGVDLDFPVVYRSLAGIDSIIQAGGRANREGKLRNPDGSPKLGQVIVFEPCSENGKIAKSLEITAKKGKETIDILGDKAFGLEGIKKYFELLYSLIEDEEVMDKKEILDEFEKLKTSLKMNFETVAKKFKLIEDNTCGIAVKCDAQSTELVDKLWKGEDIKNTARKLQGYSVSVYQNEFQRLVLEGAVEIVNGVNVLMTEKYYSEEFGLDLFTGENKNAEAFYQ
ncbi:MAG: CRISPR-associated helicase Cas3' [Oscillospiraceae bacterium]|nr:CRISPR-associated helicase Cas3' [Oscillospiraceae bacterium]